MAEANEAPEWQCHACTCSNPESFLLCATCQTQRAPCTGDWQCPRCKYVNKKPKKGKKPACYWCTKLVKNTGSFTKEEDEAPSEQIDNNNNNTNNNNNNNNNSIADDKEQAGPSAAQTATQPAAITAPTPAAAPSASPCKPSFANQGRVSPAIVVAKPPAARPRTPADDPIRESAVALGRRAANNNNGKSVMRLDSGKKEQLQSAPKPQTSLGRSNGPYAASVPPAAEGSCPVRTRPLHRDLTGLSSLPNEEQAKQKRMKMAENNDLDNKAECSNARQANGNDNINNRSNSNGNHHHDDDDNHHHNRSNNNDNNVINHNSSGGANSDGHSLRDKHKVIKEDISNGRERHAIPAVNDADDVLLPFVNARSGEDNEEEEQGESKVFRYVAQSVSADGMHGLPASQRLTGCDCNGGNCLDNPAACKCTGEARGDFCYEKDGRLKSRFAMDYRSCEGGGKGAYVYECNMLCACHARNCGNRVVQKGIAQKLQVFRTKGKGWGVQALERICARAFVFAYAGEILTNAQATERLENVPMARRCHTMELDADRFLEYEYGPDRGGLGDTELLTIDANRIGNVASFLNHSCDPNLFYRPVLVDVHDTHCYTPSFFALRDIEPMEELTWDYGKYDAPDIEYIPSFKCLCGSAKCRDKRPPSRNGNGARNR